MLFNLSMMAYFNPRSREGSDLITGETIIEPDDFNPRSREGSDIFRNLYIFQLSISIHAPVKGATAQ